MCVLFCLSTLILVDTQVHTVNYQIPQLLITVMRNTCIQDLLAAKKNFESDGFHVSVINIVSL